MRLSAKATAALWMETYGHEMARKISQQMMIIYRHDEDEFDFWYEVMSELAKLNKES